MIQIQPATKNKSVDLARLREKLAQSGGPEYWKSLEELAETEEFKRFVEDEFADRSEEWLKPANRRNVLKLMGASFALAGLSACTKQPRELIVPYVRQPEEFTPGKPLFFASAMPSGGMGLGVLVESHLGRPTKIEGNPDHPTSLGRTNIWAHAAVLDFWDPDRARAVTHYGDIGTWAQCKAEIMSAKANAALRKGAGLRILTEAVASPTAADLLNTIQKTFPQAKWHQYEVVSRAGGNAGTAAAFGRPVNALYHFEKADVIVSLDSDFLTRLGPASVRYAKDFTSRRHVMTDVQKKEQPKENLQEGYQPGPDAPFRNQASSHAERDTAGHGLPPQVKASGIPVDQVTQPRLYAVEPTPSNTGAMADHRFVVKASEVEDFTRALAAAVGVGGAAAGGNAHPAIPAIAKDLQANRGKCLVVPGEFQTPAVHALAHAMNQALGAVGNTVTYTDTPEANPVDHIASLRELVNDMFNGQVDTLIILGGNPAYNAPADLNFIGALNKVKLRVHVSTHLDETAMYCHWHVPEAHFLESWGDIRAHDGTVTVIQPLIEPLYGGKTYTEVLSVLAGESERTAHDLVKSYWAANSGAGNFDAWWQVCLHNGTVPNTALPAANATAKAPAGMPAQQQQGGGGLEIIFRPDPTIFDGRYANNGWLQELPKPLLRLTWANPVLISPKTAQHLGVGSMDVIEIDYNGRKVKAPAWVQPGQADDTLVAFLGYGRTGGGKISAGLGVDMYQFRTTNALWHGSGAQVRKLSGVWNLATVQHAQTMEERKPVRVATLAEFQKEPGFATEEVIQRWDTLYPDYHYEGYKWGMSIDLNTCIGCVTCTIACYAENNIPVVGMEETGKGRWMGWIRVDRYFHGGVDDPEVFFQPVTCMHCENAPCEVVCPVGATVHSAEGLNQMVYNRCVGTRYCSNNCPYKVRRFNFLLYSDWYTQSLYGMRNPDVTVTQPGVMEKCTYCIQRIQSAKILAEREDRRVRDGEITPACAQACPGDAIVFGDINDPHSRVAQLKAQIRDYSLLEDLNTRPRTTYLARLRNPNPELEKG